ncbi:hypothetical protein EXN22_16395 [Pseudomonas tructae]|uniref:Uncharacterized protein n=1 Tax=Pseudomonas tructae TaxID=2518644 RepID=A0A411MK71_9PSED|nr:hypothetical protein [Pseudomonas tructae]QBF27195.1 hypothetical protein EXN22_16395 [Pseudomonas tructae]
MNRNELREIITDSLVGMISGLTGMIPPKGATIPDVIQAPIDRAAGRIFAAFDQPAVQHQGEPVHMVRTHGSCSWEEASGESLVVFAADPGEYEVRKLYAHADPGEVERLRAALVETENRLEAQRQHNTQRHVELGMESMQVIGENTALRAKLAERDALLRKVRGYVVSQECITAEIDVALSASAEPSAPVERDERALRRSPCVGAGAQILAFMDSRGEQP